MFLIEARVAWILKMGRNDDICRFPFISCEIFTCEIEIILKTLVDDEEVIPYSTGFLNMHETCNFWTFYSCILISS
jgi:hypothetical protein